MSRSIVAAAALSFALAAPAVANADTTAPTSRAATPPVQLQRTTPVAETHVVYTPASTAPAFAPLAPTPKPVLSEGAKAGFIAGGIVVAALIITGVIVVGHH